MTARLFCNIFDYHISEEKHTYWVGIDESMIMENTTAQILR